MLKKSASFVLGSSKSSTYGGGLALALPVPVPAFDGTGTATKQKGGSPRHSPAASLDGLFEHPAHSSEESPYVQSGSLSHKIPVFPQTVNVAGVFTS
jgi:hypothetical protein